MEIKDLPNDDGCNARGCDKSERKREEVREVGEEGREEKRRRRQQRRSPSIGQEEEREPVADEVWWRPATAGLGGR